MYRCYDFIAFVHQAQVSETPEQSKIMLKLFDIVPIHYIEEETNMKPFTQHGGKEKAKAKDRETISHYDRFGRLVTITRSN